jgi:hypothetical protein
MRALVVLAVLLFAGPAWAQEKVDVELVLAADGSGSIDDDELALQREGYAAAVTHPRFLAAIAGGFHQKVALTYVEWGDPESQETIVDWMLIDGPESAAAFAGKLRTQPRAAWGYNSISEAIAYGIDKMLTNAFEGRRKIVDVSGDGPQMNGRPLADVHLLARQHRVTINGLVVNLPGRVRTGPMGEPLDEHYRNDVIFGRGAFVMTAEGRQDIARAVLKKMILEIAEVNPVSPIRY